ncbi:thiamine phosphate synthase [Flavobacterium rakeshii]|uniref:thiamine phosphate synthase n=1 Tax=Flavobacterium rakeshii TaxID=1038845 RepID=UPI002E7B016B|nr:thiamine phosphate synthase [Flavobacterium rakeshii]MEE1898578.1 thiamine phosphate synthase [Flavobacterium rakeshii]
MIIVTPPHSIANEVETINNLFEEGLPLLHLRKPEIYTSKLRRLIESIDSEFHSKLVLHHNYEIASDYNINRLHFTERNRESFDSILKELKTDAEYIISTSVHTMTDFNQLPSRFDYAFFSPVYNSISKPGHNPKNDLREILKQRAAFNTKLIALGGITASNCGSLLIMGFDDFALLGGFWQAENPMEEFRKCLKISNDYVR